MSPKWTLSAIFETFVPSVWRYFVVEDVDHKAADQ